MGGTREETGLALEPARKHANPLAPTLETEVPILSAVLTSHQFHDHADLHEFFRSHMVTKGKELAGACLSIIENLAAVA